MLSALAYATLQVRMQPPAAALNVEVWSTYTLTDIYVVKTCSGMRNTRVNQTGLKLHR
jgi:hypothetical protein